MVRNALPSSSLSALSSFKRQNIPPQLPHSTTSTQTDRNKRVSCPECKKLFNVYTEGPKGWNSKPHQMCIDCFRAIRRAQRQQNRKPPSTSTSAISASEPSNLTQIASVSASISPSKNNTSRDTQKVSTKTILDHHIFKNGEWEKSSLRDHPRLTINISAASPMNGECLLSHRNIAVSAIADTGAQSDLWSLTSFLAAGFSREMLSPVKLGLSAANRSSIPIEGAFFANISVIKSNTGRSCWSMIYVSSGVHEMYLSFDTMLNLGLLPNDFPDNDSKKQTKDQLPSINITRAINNGCEKSTNANVNQCSCPKRTETPRRPRVLPFPCFPENNHLMKEWLLQNFKSSTFNTCPHQPLPSMKGPPVEMHVDDSATPKAYHTAAPIPLHWQQRVYKDLLRDEALGVIERVPYGEPVNWCHRMVVTRKQDGTPRRTVDLSPLNKHCTRETYATESPFHLARRIPKSTWKTVTDAWNGYHSVPLRESDRNLTTFITPFGRWRYTRLPQGFVSSGDGYNRRFDAITSSFERKERCVDDTIHFDENLEKHWWRTINFLIIVGQAGIVLNPDKFQFAEKTVDFAGFRISESTIEPLPKYLDAIRQFPTPTSTTDIRSWFGLVNQVTNYAQLRDIMAPFKPFLSPKCKFTWNERLDLAFQRSKKIIIDEIYRGVEIFDMTKRTCLRPDWSNRGVGYFLLQQHCNCPSGIPDCCQGGWRVTLAGSRFLSSAEQRYAAVEGEALAVAWGLEQTKYFTQGCDKLVIVTDHKPLVKLLGDRTLDEISNTRLFRLKQRTLPWRFQIIHLPEKTNHAADAASRNPSSPESPNVSAINLYSAPDLLEQVLIASISNDANTTITLPWELIAQETNTDKSLRRLLEVVESGFLNAHKNDPVIASVWHIKDLLYIQNGVVLYQDRIFVPPNLRQRVLNHLHAAHQGISSMENRARAIVFWPGISKDIREVRESCTYCNRNAPSQAATPPIPSNPPATPFESIFADFFDYKGHHYLVAGDRLSGWVEVIGSTFGTNAAGSAGLVAYLRRFFATFGVPDELCSDGGSEFTAGNTASFLTQWSVRHCISSANFPQSNGRAEVAVKKVKRLLQSNTGPTGSLDNDGFLKAMLQLRNTPDPDCNISPAEIIFGRPLRDEFSFMNHLEKYSNPHIRPLWRDAWAAKEDALRTRMSRTTESLAAHSRPLHPLHVGDRVFVQNQRGPNPNKWDKSGTVVETLEHDQYRVKVDGSGRLTLRNRRFLRAFTPISESLKVYDSHRSSPTTPFNQPQDNLSAADTQPRDIVQDYSNHTDPQPRDIVQDYSDHTTPPHTEAEVVPESQLQQPSRRQIMRTRRAPKRYEPETGLWIE